MRNSVLIFGLRIADCGLQNIRRLRSDVRNRQPRCAPVFAWMAAAFATLFLAGTTRAQSPEMLPGLDPTAIGQSAPPMASYSEGSFFSQDLGTVLRLQYRTESYGQNDHGNLDIGTMQVFNLDQSIAFFDGQVTLNDIQGVGFNIGAGYRWLHDAPYALESQRVAGWSLWVDGTSTKVDNFFPQLGVSFESLGDTWDFRANGYIPLGDQDQVGDFESTGVIDFQGNFVSEITQAVVDSSYYAAELEVARRLGADRDAWAFAGPYFVGNDNDDAIGYKVGVRGYAYPDLLLQFAVSDDEIFATKATFSLVWFVGRTRSDFQPACGPADRLREPVLRNDYVVLSHSVTNGGIPLTNSSGDPIRVVHVDSSAAGGGDGTIENPLNNLNDIFNSSQEGDIVLAHAESTFTGQNAILQDRQRFLGEGNNMIFTVATSENGTINIPETTPGARALARPQILASPGNAITLADANEVANFDIDGQDVTEQAIASPLAGAGNPNLHDMVISNTLGDAIELTTLSYVDTDDIDGDGNTTETFVRGNVTIRNITFNSIGDGLVDALDATDFDDEIDINRFTTVDVTAANVTLQEAISIVDVTSNNSQSRGIYIEQTHTAGTATITNYVSTGATPPNTGGAAPTGRIVFDDISGDVTIGNPRITNGTGFAFDFFNVSSDSAITINQLAYDGGMGAAGGIRAATFDGTLNVNNSTFRGGTLEGVALLGNSDGTFNFAASTNFMNIGGTAFLIDGDDAGSDTFTGTVSVNGAITNDTGFSVVVNNVNDATTSITFLGDITDTGLGIRANSNTDGTILFGGELSLTTEDSTAILLTDNNNADIDFTDLVEIVTTSGDGLVATGGGSLSMTNQANTITTDTGRAVVITGMAIDSPGGVSVSEVNRTSAADTQAILLQSNTGGPIVLGTVTETDNGTLQGGLADTVVVENSANVTLTGFTINNAAGFSGVRASKSTTGGMTFNLNDLTINGGDIGIEFIGGGGTAGNLTMSINDSTITGATDVGLSFNNLDVGTVQVNNLDIDGTGAGVRIVGSNATFTFDAETLIENVMATDFEVSGGTGNITYAGDILNTVGRSVHIHDVSGGNITFSSASMIDDDGLGILVENNTAGSISFFGMTDLDPLAAAMEAVLLNNNMGAAINFNGLNILTATGSATRGFVAQGGGLLTVSGNTNIINTENGTALLLNGMTIGSVDFQTVTADGGTGPGNAIVLQNLTNGQVAIGPASGAVGAGGVLRTTDDAIILENVQNVDLRQIQILAAGDAAGEHGVEIIHSNAATTAMDVTIDGLNVAAAAGMDAAISLTGASTNALNVRLTDSTLNNNVAMSITGAGAFGLLLDNNDITVASGGDIAFALSFSGTAQNGDVTIRNGNNFTADAGSAFSLTTSGANAKTVDLLIDGAAVANTFTSASAAASANFLIQGSSTLNANIQTNTFDNSVGTDFMMEAGSSALSRIRLNLGGDDPTDFNTALGGGFDLLQNNGADFRLTDRDDTLNDMRNNGPVDGVGTFGDLGATMPPFPIVP